MISSSHGARVTTSNENKITYGYRHRALASRFNLLATFRKKVRRESRSLHRLVRPVLKAIHKLAYYQHRPATQQFGLPYAKRMIVLVFGCENGKRYSQRRETRDESMQAVASR